MPITDTGNGSFTWTDENGSEVVWRSVGTFPDGLVWYATGKVKPAVAAPSVPVKAVAVLTRHQKVSAEGRRGRVPRPACKCTSTATARRRPLALRV